MVGMATKAENEPVCLDTGLGVVSVAIGGGKDGKRNPELGLDLKELSRECDEDAVVCDDVDVN